MIEANSLNNARVFIAVTASAAVGLGLYFMTQLHEFIALGAAVATFGLAHLIVPRATEDGEVMVASGVTRADLKLVQSQGRAQIDRLDKALDMLPATDPAAGLIRAIEDIFKSIYANLDEDPADIPTSRAFLSFHSSDAIGLIESYVKLVSNRLPDDEKLTMIEASRTRFVAIEKAFRAQYNAMLANDVSALEQAGRNLESSLRLEHGLEKIAVGGPEQR